MFYLLQESYSVCSCNVSYNPTTCRKLVPQLHNFLNLNVHGVCFSEDGKLIANASEDRSVKIWIADSNQISSQAAEGHRREICAVASKRLPLWI